MWWPIILIGGPWFWLMTVGWIVWLLVVLDCIDDYDYYDRKWPGTWATVLTFSFVGVVCVFGSGLTTALSWVAAYWVWILALYLPGAILTALTKWYYFCHDCKEDLEERICSWKRTQGLADPDKPTLPADLRMRFLKWLYDGAGYPRRWVRKIDTTQSQPEQYELILPTWQQHKARICTWMTWWWIVAPWSFVHDFVHRLFGHIMKLVGGWFNKIAIWVFGDLANFK